MGWMGQVTYEIVIGCHRGPSIHQPAAFGPPTSCQGQQPGPAIRHEPRGQGENPMENRHFFPAKSWYPPVN